jgi:hypothetical protein
MKLLIKNTTRGSIVVSVDGRRLTVGCEALLPGYGSPDFVIFSNSVTEWAEGPKESAMIDENVRLEIFKALKSALAARQLTCEIV